MWAYLSTSIEVHLTLRLLLAAILGGIVGLERGSGDRPAGFRTHILVCAGSALIMLVSLYGFEGFDVNHLSTTGRDSARIAAQVVSGIGFLGAGTIMHEGVTVRGLTTAASLWMVSAIGLAVGAGMYFISIVSTFITMITLVTFHNWEKRFALINRNDRRFVRVVARNRPGVITEVTSYLATNGIKLKTINVRNDANGNQIVMELYLKIDKEMDAGVISALQGINGIVSVENEG